MKPFRPFPTIRPRHSFESVVRELIEGLRDGSIVLDNPLPRAMATPYSDNGSSNIAMSDHPHGPLLEIAERAKG
jgi:hypothetical protein